MRGRDRNGEAVRVQDQSGGGDRREDLGQTPLLKFLERGGLWKTRMLSVHNKDNDNDRQE